MLDCNPIALHARTAVRPVPASRATKANTGVEAENTGTLSHANTAARRIRASCLSRTCISLYDLATDLHLIWRIDSVIGSALIIYLTGVKNEKTVESKIVRRFTRR